MPVSDVVVGVIVFGLLFGGALLGMLLDSLGAPHPAISAPMRDVIRVVMAMLATLSAVVLGLLTGAAINSLAEKEGELRKAGVQFIMLDRTLADYGSGRREPARVLLKQTLSQNRIAQIWPADGSEWCSMPSAAARGSGWVQSLFALAPRHRGTALAPSRMRSLTPTPSPSRAGPRSSRSAAGFRGRSSSP